VFCSHIFLCSVFYFTQLGRKCVVFCKTTSFLPSFSTVHFFQTIAHLIFFVLLAQSLCFNSLSFRIYVSIHCCSNNFKSPVNRYINSVHIFPVVANGSLFPDALCLLSFQCSRFPAICIASYSPDDGTLCRFLRFVRIALSIFILWCFLRLCEFVCYHPLSLIRQLIRNFRRIFVPFSGVLFSLRHGN